MLWNVSEPPPDTVPPRIAYLIPQIRAYVTEFLVDKHPARKGQICPFMSGALINKGVLLSYIDAYNTSDIVKQAKKIAKEYLKAKIGKTRGKTSVVIILPSDLRESVHVKAQLKLKKFAIRHRIMVGALSPRSNAPSLHDERYFPLRTPSPTLVLRDLMVQDLTFLTQEKHAVLDKIYFLNSYIRNFRHDQSKNTHDGIFTAKHIRGKLIKAVIEKFLIFLAIIALIGVLLINVVK